jgi:hypothetical protein
MRFLIVTFTENKMARKGGELLFNVLQDETSSGDEW